MTKSEFQRIEDIISKIQEIEPGSGGCNEIDHDEATAQVLAEIDRIRAEALNEAAEKIGGMGIIHKCRPLTVECIRAILSDTKPSEKAAPNTLSDIASTAAVLRMELRACGYTDRADGMISEIRRMAGVANEEASHA